MSALITRYRDSSLSTKFTFILIAVFLTAISIGGFVLYQAAHQRAQVEIVTQGETLLNTMNAVRAYTSGHVNPLVAPQMTEETGFIPETVPSYSARTVFEQFRTNEEFRDFLYREATLNPTNPLNKADDFETELVNRFRADNNLDEQTGFRTLDGERLFYIARPLSVSSEACLVCHTSPEVAPPSLVASYGEEHGFGWQLNEIIAAQIIYVPADDVMASGRQLFLGVIAVFAALFAVAIILLNRLMKPTVVRPVQEMATLAQQISEDKLDDGSANTPYLSQVAARGDELGHMVQVFQQMAQQVRKREVKLKTELEQLRIEIDETRRQRDVRQIADTEYFQDLQRRASDLRQRFKKADDTPST